MKFLFASDSFKGTLSTEKTAELLTKAAKQVFPQCGPQGATYTYGPQKGSTTELLESLEEGMCNFRDVISNEFGGNLDNVPGSGAEKILNHGISHIIATAPSDMPLAEAMQRAEELYLEAAVRMFTGIKFGKKV